MVRIGGTGGNQSIPPSSSPEPTQQREIRSPGEQNTPLQSPETSPAQPSGSARGAEQAGRGLEAERRLEGQLRQAEMQSSISRTQEAQSQNAGRVPEATYNRIRDRLSYGMTDWAITNNDVRAVHSELSGLSPADYRATMQRMQTDGLLNRYIGNMDPPERRAFVQQAAHNGYIQRAEAGRTPEGRFNPPAQPQMLINNRNLPPSVRNAVHEQNVETANRYNQQYGEYIQRYRNEVMRAPDAATIRSMGPPSPRIALAEPGVQANHPDSDRFNRDWYDRVHAHSPHESTGYQAISDRVHDLTGVRRPGDVWLRLQVGASIQHAGEHGSTGLGVDTRLSTEQGLEGPQVQATTNASAGGVQLGTGVGPESGSASVGLQTGYGIGGSQTSGTGIQVNTDGEVDTSVGVNEGPVQMGAYGTATPRQATLEAGASAQGNVGVVQLQGRLGVGTRGITPAEARNSVDGPGFFQPPQELRAGQSWDSIPESQRERYALLGWTRDEWNGRLNR